MAAFEARLDAYTKAIDHYVSAGILPEAFATEEVTSRIDEIKAMLISALMRRWMSSENILPELNEMIQLDPDGKLNMGIGSEVQDHNSAMSKVVVDMLARAKPIGDAARADVARIAEGDDLGESTAQATDTSGSDTTKDSGSGDGNSADSDAESGAAEGDTPEDDGMSLPGLDDLG